MHEMALAQSVLEIVEQTAREHGARCVTGVRIEIGALSHVEAEALRFCFDIVMRGSVADGARLDIEATPGAAWCMPCAATVPLARVGEACPHCGSYQLAVTDGGAMRVREIEVAGARERERATLQGEA
ncbi:MAG TPA: hydrogenase maturation nickel metallochaperone HypA [Casimicrobiaceae bacterium]|nr:hydrogenase maturation nickel metallochaperone HypA [Casimicrobiaceae bacterium]